MTNEKAGVAEIFDIKDKFMSKLLEAYKGTEIEAVLTSASYESYKKIDMLEAAEFSHKAGDILSGVICEEIESGTTIDSVILRKALETGLKFSTEAAGNVLEQAVRQTDKQCGVNIKFFKTEFPTKRISALADGLTDKSYNKPLLKAKLKGSVQNVGDSFFTDAVKANAAIRADAGLDVYIIRKGGGNCCDWCRNLIGKYKYGEEPEDVYRRHDNCGCTTTYICGSGARRTAQDVWRKQTRTISAAQEKELMRFSASEASEIQERILKKMK